MPKNVVQYDLLISCPRDITTEISIIEDAVSQFNTQFSDALELVFAQNTGIKTLMPGLGEISNIAE